MVVYNYEMVVSINLFREREKSAISKTSSNTGKVNETDDQNSVLSPSVTRCER